MPQTWRLSPKDQIAILRSVILPADLKQKLSAAPVLDQLHRLALTDDEYLCLAQHLTMTINNAGESKIGRTLKQILQRLTEQNEGPLAQRLSDPLRDFSTAGIKTTIAFLAGSIPGWSDFNIGQMASEMAEHTADATDVQIARAIEILHIHHDEIARPMFYGLTTNQIGDLLQNDWQPNSPGIVLHPENLTANSIQEALIVRRAVTVINALGKEGTKATKRGNLNRKFVASIHRELDLPEYIAADIFRYNKVVNEEDVFALHEQHIWLRSAKLLRLHRGRIVPTKLALNLLAKSDWCALFTKLFAAVFDEYNLAYRDRLPVNEAFQQTIEYSFHQISRLDEGWQNIEERCDRLILPIISDHLNDPASLQLPRALVISRLLVPLSLFGLVELKENNVGDGELAYPELVEFRRTALFAQFFGAVWSK